AAAVGGLEHDVVNRVAQDAHAGDAVGDAGAAGVVDGVVLDEGAARLHAHRRRVAGVRGDVVDDVVDDADAAVADVHAVARAIGDGAVLQDAVGALEGDAAVVRLRPAVPLLGEVGDITGVDPIEC